MFGEMNYKIGTTIVATECVDRCSQICFMLVSIADSRALRNKNREIRMTPPFGFVAPNQTPYLSQ